MEKRYYKIDVIGNDGYSFMVWTTDMNITDEEVIDLALDSTLFLDDDDANRCMVDALVDDNDIQYFKKIDCLYEI